MFDLNPGDNNYCFTFTKIKILRFFALRKTSMTRNCKNLWMLQTIIFPAISFFWIVIIRAFRSPLNFLFMTENLFSTSCRFRYLASSNCRAISWRYIPPTTLFFQERIGIIESALQVLSDQTMNCFRVVSSIHHIALWSYLVTLSEQPACVPNIVNPTFRSDKPGDHLLIGINWDWSFQEMLSNLACSGWVIVTRISAGKSGWIDRRDWNRIVLQ